MAKSSKVSVIGTEDLALVKVPVGVKVRITMNISFSKDHTAHEHTVVVDFGGMPGRVLLEGYCSGQSFRVAYQGRLRSEPSEADMLSVMKKHAVEGVSYTDAVKRNARDLVEIALNDPQRMAEGMRKQGVPEEVVAQYLKAVGK